MSVQELATQTANTVLDRIGADESHNDEVAAIIQQALMKVMSDTRAGCQDVVNICCNADQDLAHKIGDQMRQKEELLVTSLMSMR